MLIVPLESQNHDSQHQGVVRAEQPLEEHQ